MKAQIKKQLKKKEWYIAIAILVLAMLVEMRSGQFFTGNNMVDLARAMTIPAMFCVGEMIVLISGGTDVSFPAIASLSMYVVSKYMIDFEGSVVVLLIIGTVLGAIMGALNGYLIGKFRFNALIVTLGTTSLFTGILQGVLGAHENPIPVPMYNLGKAKLFSVANSELGISSDMPIAILFLIALLALTWFIMQKTMLGRGIYAIGGDIVSAERSGFPVFKIQMFIYCFTGAIAGLGGILRSSMILIAHPTNLNGMEMICISACVLGGVAVTGGKGSITGTMLGIGLMIIMSTSLILLGIPTYWQKVFTGAIIIIGTGVSAYQVLRNKKRLVEKAIG